MVRKIWRFAHGGEKMNEQPRVSFLDLKSGMLLKESWGSLDIFLVVKDKAEVILRNISTGEYHVENKTYCLVGKERNEKILALVLSWGCREPFPTEEFQEILRTRSDNRKKTYVCFPDDGSDSYMAVFTSISITDAEAYYLYLKSHGYLFG